MNNLESTQLIWSLAQIPGFGIQTLKMLREQLKPELTFEHVCECIGRNFENGSEYILELKEILASGAFEQELEECNKRHFSVLSYLDSNYPKNLSTIYDPPPVLYVSGSFVPEDEMAIALVGSRKASSYGIRMSGKFAFELAESGMTIISGLARGIDAEAHRGAMRAKGRTIAVLGSGLDVIYPKEHAELFNDVSNHGAVISEFPLGTMPLSFNFPMRNRIISGLSRGVLVIEANKRSGSLITATSAGEEGREVYAVPGPVDSITSSGTNHLIQNGAKLVTSSQDILEDLMPQVRAYLPKNETPNSIEQNETDPIFKLLSKNPISFDELLITSGEDSAHLQSHLLHLELKGVVKRIFGGQYVRR